MKVADKNLKDLKQLISKEEISAKIIDLAKIIDSEFKGTEELFVICVLKGSAIFCCDLVKCMQTSVKMEFIRISSYGDDCKSCNSLKAIDLTLPDMKGKDVLIVEDIVDTGLTAKFLVDLIKVEHEPEKLRFVSLLNKKCARKIEIEPDLYGFEVDDKFVVGYGLDYKGFFRNLPYIGYFPQ